MRSSAFEPQKTLGGTDEMITEFKAQSFIFTAQASEGAGESFHLYARFFYMICNGQRREEVFLLLLVP